MNRKLAVLVVAGAALALVLQGVPGRAAERRAPAGSRPAAEPTRLDERSLDRYRVRPDEVAAIRSYYQAHPAPAPEPAPAKKKKKIPRGLQKKVARGGELPPGWQRKIARGEVMDPVVYEHSRPLPPELVKTLPPQPQGTVIVTVEGKAVRLLEATMTILDAFDLL